MAKHFYNAPAQFSPHKKSSWRHWRVRRHTAAVGRRWASDTARGSHKPPPHFAPHKKGALTAWANRGRVRRPLGSPAVFMRETPWQPATIRRLKKGQAGLRLPGRRRSARQQFDQPCPIRRRELGNRGGQGRERIGRFLFAGGPSVNDFRVASANAGANRRSGFRKSLCLATYVAKLVASQAGCRGFESLRPLLAAAVDHSGPRLFSFGSFSLS
jgi:hypothetical protein